MLDEAIEILQSRKPHDQELSDFLQQLIPILLGFGEPECVRLLFGTYACEGAPPKWMDG